MMKIKISKTQWETIGRKAGWRKAQTVDQLMPTDGVQKDPSSKPKFVKKEETQKVDTESKEEMLKTYLEFKNNGRANEKGVTEKDVDENELAAGIEVEFEHTTDRETAKRIALDHLAELKDYYTRLKKMEEEGKAEGSELK